MTTDPQHELFDILDADGNPTGEIKPRGQVHRDGDWHRGLHVWVYGIDTSSQPFILFQRRSMGKDTWPGKLDLAVGGHFSAGERLEDALRESEEEIGLSADVSDLVPLGRRFIEDFGTGYIDRELDEVYALRCDQPLESYRLHDDEVDGVLAISVADVRRLFHDERSSISAREVERSGNARIVTIRLDDFAGDRATYRNAVIDSIETLVNGGWPEPFLLREPRS
jgi:isopentenyldiphosphate isomerase